MGGDLGSVGLECSGVSMLLIRERSRRDLEALR